MVGSTEEHHETCGHPVSGVAPEARISQDTAWRLFIPDDETDVILNETDIVTLTVTLSPGPSNQTQ